MLLAGCASGGGYGDAPRIADPSPQGIDEPYRQAAQDFPEPTPRMPQGELQGDYRPEAGTPSYDAAQEPERRSTPGAGYDRPGARPARVPSRVAAGDLQRDYQPEPGAPTYEAERDAPRRTTPGAGYDRPGTRPTRTPVRAAPEPAYSEPAARPPLPADAPPALASGTGPRGTSGEAQRYDAVGYASWYGEEMGDARTASGERFDPSAITAAHGTLPLGSVVEVTSLDTGRTILAIVNDRGPGAPGREIDLSRGAAQALGLTNAMAPVRVRLVTATASDTVALRQGRPAGQRIDAPPSLLVALRRKLPARAAMPSPQRPARQQPGTAYAPPVARAPAAPRGGAGLFVQVAALSSAQRAQALADSLGGRIERAGSVYRVQIGPFADTRSAQRARDDVARRGYGDARIVQTN